jgi:hypothetical protein
MCATCLAHLILLDIVKVNISMYNMDVYREVEGEGHSSLTLALDEGEWLA